MSSPFDAPGLNRADGDARYLSYAITQALTEDEQVLIRTNLGLAASGNIMALTTDPDGEQVIVIQTDLAGTSYDGGEEY